MGVIGSTDRSNAFSDRRQAGPTFAKERVSSADDFGEREKRVSPGTLRNVHKLIRIEQRQAQIRKCHGVGHVCIRGQSIRYACRKAGK